MNIPAPILYDAAKRCVDLHIPFALYLYPDDEEWHFVASMTVDEADSVESGFSVGFFNEDSSAAVKIPSRLSPTDVLALPAGMQPLESSDVRINTNSTRFINYYAQCQEIIRQLKRAGGKTVLSRVIKLCSDVHPLDASLEYFRLLPRCFRAIYFTAATGLWIVATPELLLKRLGENEVATMSLAGTRWNDNSSAPWDEKNVDEHAYVTDYITTMLKDSGLEVTVSSPETLVYGPVQHLCERIHARGEVDFMQLIDSLSPTPAVCGIPVESALRMIESFESHDRVCYSGWIMVKEGECMEAYVNLRCAMALPVDSGFYCYNIFAGGGITAASEPLKEWNEAGNKALLLANAVVGDKQAINYEELSALVYSNLSDALNE